METVVISLVRVEISSEGPPKSGPYSVIILV